MGLCRKIDEREGGRLGGWEEIRERGVRRERRDGWLRVRKEQPWVSAHSSEGKFWSPYPEATFINKNVDENS